MRTIHALAAAAILAAPASASAAVLTVQQLTQEQNQWCWAGTSRCVMLYYGVDRSQCSIAEYARTQITWHDFGTVNCCVSASSGCNYWNYMWGYPGAIDDIVSTLGGITTYSYGYALTQSQVINEIDAGYPFFIRWGWDTGGGHFVVGHGYNGSSLYYMDPWYGEGLKIADYSWVVRSAANGNTWTHSLTTVGPVGPCAGKVDGSACNDNSACTTNDRCQAGQCRGTQITCPSSNPCSVGSCDATSGLCKLTPLADGTACTDGSACTANDRCQAGQCKGTQVTCPSTNPCSVGSCDATSGFCKLTPVADGTVCSDGTNCTTNDRCQAGQCKGTTIVCTALDACHVGGTCNATSGTCTNPVAPDGTVCNDGNAGTSNDLCVAGVCRGTVNLCAGKPDGTACDDGNAGTTNDQCMSGVCRGTASACAGKPDGTACDDGNAGTSNDRCVSGVCQGTASACVGKPDGTACDDGNAGTANDRCVAGVCRGTVNPCAGEPDGTLCNDGNAGTYDDQCVGGVCKGTAGTVDCARLPDGEPCNDGDPATADDQCVGGVCEGTAASDGCAGKANGASCDDGDDCTVGDVCLSGSCRAGSSVECPAPDACHAAGSCLPQTGECEYPLAADGAACDDGQAGTVDDRCQVGRCVGTPESQQCRGKPDGAECSLGTCQGGTCKPVPGLIDEGLTGCATAGGSPWTLLAGLSLLGLSRRRRAR